MNRRKFLMQTGLVGGGLILAPSVFAETTKKKSELVILHTNDTHSNIDALPENHAKFPGMGGAAKRMTLIQKIRDEYENVLLLDSGDIFQGTPYFNLFHGELEMKLMSEMGYDAATMGNHDFDIGLDGFLNAQRFSNFPFVCSNYDFTKTLLKEATKPYIILKKGGLKIGIFGIGVALQGLVPADKCQGVNYLHPIQTANATAAELKRKGCDLIICLSHLGYDYEDKTRFSDLYLAKNSKDIHVILGGHTHTFLEKPTLLLNKKNRNVVVNQVGWAGVNIGMLRIDFEKGGFHSEVLVV